MMRCCLSSLLAFSLNDSGEFEYLSLWSKSKPRLGEWFVLFILLIKIDLFFYLPSKAGNVLGVFQGDDLGPFLHEGHVVDCMWR